MNVRRNIKDLKQIPIKTNRKIINNYYKNMKVADQGILKKSKNDEDIYEKLASQIYDLCGVDAEHVSLYEDDENNKYSLIDEALKETTYVSLKEPEMINQIDMSEEELYNEYMNDIKNQISDLNDIELRNSYQIYKKIVQILLVNSIINNKNMDIEDIEIEQITPSKYNVPLASNLQSSFFNGDSKGLFKYLDNQEIIRQIVVNDYKIIDGTIDKIIENITEDRLVKVMKQEYVNVDNKEDIIMQMIVNVNTLIEEKELLKQPQLIK